MIDFTTSNGTSIRLMTHEGHALSMQPAEGKNIIPQDILEFIEWLKHDSLRCYVAVDAFGQVALSQLFPQQAVAPAAESPQETSPTE